MGALEVLARLNCRALEVTISGTMDDDVEFQLFAHLAEVHDEAVRLEVDTVNLDLRRVERAGSSVVGALCHLGIQARPGAFRPRLYRPTFTLDAASAWQLRASKMFRDVGADVALIKA